MNVKQLLVLLVVLAAVGAFVLTQDFSESPQTSASDFYLYNIEPRAINMVEIAHLGETRRFVRDASVAGWVFEDETRSRVSSSTS